MEHIVVLASFFALLYCFYVVWLIEKDVRKSKALSAWIEDESEQKFRSRRRTPKNFNPKP